jgi:alanine racemase
MELRSHVAFVKTVKKGEAISYGRTFTAENDMKIATIPVGYADGYPRILSGKGRVIINGKYAPIVGRVCMDQITLDVSNINDVNTGDEVILLDEEYTADDMANLIGTIGYEVVCNISNRVERKYIK